MKFSEENNASYNRVTRYDEHGIEVNHQRFTESIILIPDKPVTPWAASSPDAIDQNTIEQLIQLKPEILLLGTGRNIQFIDSMLMVQLAKEGIGMETLDTPSACRTFNLILSEGRYVIAALLPPDAV